MKPKALILTSAFALLAQSSFAAMWAPPVLPKLVEVSGIEGNFKGGYQFAFANVDKNAEITLCKHAPTLPNNCDVVSTTSSTDEKIKIPIWNAMKERFFVSVNEGGKVSRSDYFEIPHSEVSKSSTLLTSDRAHGNSYFGDIYAVSGDGSTVAISSVREYLDDGTSVNPPIYIYKQNDGWNLTQKFDVISPTSGNALHPSAVHVTNDASKIFVGASNYLFVYEFNENEQAYQYTNHFNHTSALSYLWDASIDVSEDESVVVIGSTMKGTGSHGIVQILIRNESGDYVLHQTFEGQPTSSGSYAHFGVKTKLSGRAETLVIGTSTGYANIYRKQPDMTYKLATEASDLFYYSGVDVSPDGKLVVVNHKAYYEPALYFYHLQDDETFSKEVVVIESEVKTGFRYNLSISDDLSRIVTTPNLSPDGSSFKALGIMEKDKQGKYQYLGALPRFQNGLPTGDEIATSSDGSVIISAHREFDLDENLSAGAVSIYNN